MPASWYGVKTIYRIEAAGRPKGADEDYDPEATMFEERIVLVQASSLQGAIEKAERDAREYAEGFEHENPYGQKVRCRYLGEYDVFEMLTKPADRVEVYSRTELVSKKVKDKILGDWAFGTEGNAEAPLRKKFFARE
ncbi:MAG: DUF4288 domain-containing protein [Myxococcales bacterium]|jgi:hypothetical protein